jgi:NAD-dependent deacetylase
LDQAGCERVFHMHGELAKMRCIKTGQVFDAPESFDATDECECCGELANLRPHIVWFGEIPFYMDEIEKALSDCDIFISVGTSNNVYPAAGFVQVAKSLGAKCIEVNYEPTQLSSVFDENHYGKAGDRLGEVLKNFTGLF